MIELEGEILEHHRPERPGHWFYRQLPDGQVLAVEFSNHEMIDLMNVWRNRSHARMAKLNDHPLNQVAITLLNRSSSHNPTELALLQLVMASFIEEDRCDSIDEDMMFVISISSEPKRCGGFMEVMDDHEDEIMECLESSSVAEAGRLIWKLFILHLNPPSMSIPSTGKVRARILGETVFFDGVVWTEGEPFLLELLNGLTSAHTGHHIDVALAAERILATVSADWEILEAEADEWDEELPEGAED